MKLAYSFYVPPSGPEENLPPIILIHGMTDSKNTWKTIGPEIAAQTGRRVYAVDLRNHGDSGWSDDFNFDSLANDIEEFMDDNNIAKCLPVGHSMGGIVAMTLSLRKPERVEKLIAEDIYPTPFTLESLPMFKVFYDLLRDAVAALPKMTDEHEAVEATKKSIIQLAGERNMLGEQPEVWSLYEWAVKLKEDGTCLWKTNLDGLEKATTHEDYSKEGYSGIYHGKALFVYGPNSINKVDDAETVVKKYFPNGKLIPVEGAGHDVHAEYPNEFIEVAVKFINSGGAKAEGKPVKLKSCVYVPASGTEQHLPPIILIHSFLGSKATWEEVGPKLAARTGRKVFAVDLRNHGDSEWSDEFNHQLSAADISNFMNDNNIPKATVIGHSIGGLAAMALALQMPQKVEKMVIEDMYPIYSTPKEVEAFCFWLKALQESGKTVPKELDELSARKVMAENAEKSSQLFMPESKENIFRNWPIRKLDHGTFTWKANIDGIIKGSMDNPSERLSGLYEGDALFIYGTESHFKVDTHDHLIKQLFPNAELSPVKGCSHDVHRDFPEEFLQIVSDFL